MSQEPIFLTRTAPAGGLLIRSSPRQLSSFIVILLNTASVLPPHALLSLVCFLTSVFCLLFTAPRCRILVLSPDPNQPPYKQALCSVTTQSLSLTPYVPLSTRPREPDSNCASIRPDVSY